MYLNSRKTRSATLRGRLARKLPFVAGLSLLAVGRKPSAPNTIVSGVDHRETTQNAN